MHMARQFKDRLRSYKPVNDKVSHVDKKPDMTGTGAGTKHLNVYGPVHTEGALLGSHWAMAPQLSPTGTFKHTNGLFPDVHSHSKRFADATNYTGGVRQTPPYAVSTADVGHAPVKTFSARYHIQGQGSGRTFWSERQKVRAQVNAKISKDR